jgi:hypothetical protein
MNNYFKIRPKFLLCINHLVGVSVKFKHPLIKTSLVLSILTFAIGLSAQTVNPMPKVSNDWRFSASINGWAPESWTTTTVGGLSKSAFSSISDNINSAGGMAMLTGEAHKGDWGMMADLVYWQMLGSGSKTRFIPSKDDASIYAGVNGKDTQTILTLAGTYTALHSNNLYIDGLAGVRYISATTSLDVTTKIALDGSTVATSSRYPSATNQTMDPVIGFKGRARIADTSWFVPFYADMGKGPGTNNGTWQTLVGVGNAYSWGDVTLAYRAMGFHLNGNIGKTNYTNAGPQLSATINF